LILKRADSAAGISGLGVTYEKQEEYDCCRSGRQSKQFAIIARPKEPRGKSYSRRNALKHGLFSKELVVSQEDTPQFEKMRDSLSRQFTAATPLQEIAVNRIVCCCWRCKLALRLESRILASQQNSDKEAEMEKAGGNEANRMEQWYATDYRSLQEGLRFLKNLRADVAQNGLLHLVQDGPLKESVIKSFGLAFYDRLIEWKGLSIDAILLASHLVEHTKRFKVGTVPDIKRRDPLQFETPRVVVDPQMQLQMAVKLVESEIEHLEILSRRGQDLSETPLVLAELSPRYFAAASRDLERAVDWFRKLRDDGC